VVGAYVLPAERASRKQGHDLQTCPVAGPSRARFLFSTVSRPCRRCVSHSSASALPACSSPRPSRRSVRRAHRPHRAPTAPLGPR
jgi:hypothetical protein